LGSTAGILIASASGTIANSGTISQTGIVSYLGTGRSAGIYLSSGGLVTNARDALVSGVTFGIHILGDSGTVTNFGTILTTGTTGSSYGIICFLTGGGTITNAAGGVIRAANHGIELKPTTSEPAETVIVNSGTIEAT